MQEELKTVIIQSSLEWENPKSNLTFFEEKIKSLTEEADLIVLPEMFTTGFTMNAKEVAEDSEGAGLKWMLRLAKEANTAITGSIVVEEGNSYYNRLYFVFPNGDFRRYDKKHTFTLAGENKVYASGREKLIVDYKGWRICPLICYDLRFPVWSRNVEDYDVLIFVANWPKRRVQAWDALLKARAIENMSYCIGVNRTGLDGNGVEYPGHSMVVDGLGNELLEYDKDSEAVLYAKLQKSHLEKIRESLRFLQDRDEFILK